MSVKDESMLELLELYMDMTEKQDEIIYRMSQLLKQYATELQHLRNIHQFLDVDPEQKLDEAILEECIEQYENMKE